MGIQSFTPSSGGVPGKEFIAQTYLPTDYRQWTQAGGPGYYTVISSGGNAGYVYFNGSAVSGAPLNGVADVTGGSGFTSITIVGKTGDVLSLYKVTGIKATTSMSATLNTTTFSSTNGAATLATNKTGFVDAFLVGGGGGGGGQHYGSGGGGGGVVLLQAWPLDPTKSFSVTIGSHGTPDGTGSNGGDTKFAGAVAKGGGAGARNHNGSGLDGGCGGGAGSHGSAAATPGKSIQGSGTAALEVPSIFPSAFGNQAALTGFGNAGAFHSPNGNHNGGGGGGAGAAASGHAGGAGYTLSWNGLQYGAGGAGNRHSSDGTSSNGSGWGNPGSGSYSQSQSHGATAGTAGVVIIRSYSLS